MNKLCNGQEIETIYGNKAVVLSAGTDHELTKLDRAIIIGFYGDDVPHYNQFIDTQDLLEIIKK